MSAIVLRRGDGVYVVDISNSESLTFMGELASATFVVTKEHLREIASIMSAAESSNTKGGWSTIE